MTELLPFAELLDLPALTLATSVDGDVHAATVYFACGPDLGFYFLSSPHSQHGRDLGINPRAAAALDGPAPRWQEIRGLQMRGSASEVSALAEQAAAWARFLLKFPYVANLQAEVPKNRWYVFRPDWLRWIDNRVRFGYKQEWDGADLRRLIETSSR